MKAELKNDFQSLLPDLSDGWLIKKETQVNIIDEQEWEYLCEYIEYSFWIPKELVNVIYVK